ncbi:hypothetical protein AVEN_129501-1 [Araneus ventricosus]|uniref:Uncharacterized protein n=1 Tax=Araneus ventricosus TaxID=182803 RepID=A0A4Y2PRF6_ARAVE|nr:hypothetical protein AVEN_129501-1 [Araneus ventricosus]
MDSPVPGSLDPHRTNHDSRCAMSKQSRTRSHHSPETLRVQHSRHTTQQREKPPDRFLLSRIRSIQRESIVIVKKFELEILRNVHVSDLPESEKHNFGIMSVFEYVVVGIPNIATTTKITVVNCKPAEVAGQPAMSRNELCHLRMVEVWFGKDMWDIFSCLFPSSGQIPPVLPMLQEFIPNFSSQTLLDLAASMVTL